MKHIKTLLGLVLVVFVLAGCSNPAGPEISEENVEYVEVSFEWSKNPRINKFSDENYFRVFGPLYLLGLHPNSSFDGYEYAYSRPEKYTEEFYTNLLKKGNEELYKEFFDKAFKSVFRTKRYKKGETIYLEQWTSRAVNLEINTCADCLRFSTKDIDETEKLDIESTLNEINVGDKDIVVYVFWDSAARN